MTSTTSVYALAYRLDIEGDPLQKPRLRVSTAVVRGGDAEPSAWRPETLTFDLPTREGFHRRVLNTSDVYGLLGGVADDYQRACSEASERALGDVLTITLCEILGRDNGQESETLIAVFGPPLPKVVGRFASLRPPEAASIAWLSPPVFPDRICRGATKALDVSIQFEEGPTQLRGGWEGTNLLYTDKVEVRDGTSYGRCWVHALDLYQQGSAVMEKVRRALEWWFFTDLVTVVEPDPDPPADDSHRVNEASPLPREVAVAVDQAVRQSRHPYEEKGEVQLEPSGTLAPYVEFHHGVQPAKGRADCRVVWRQPGYRLPTP